MGLRTMIWREHLLGKITLRTVNTTTGGQMNQTMAATKTASLFCAFLQMKG